jgi:hypothetical protein
MPILGVIASSKLTAADVGDFESIATINGTGSTPTLTFTNIPNTYTNLQIRMSLVTSGSFQQNSVYGGWVTFNNDTGSNYSDHYLYGDGATPGAGATINKANMGLIAYGAGPTYPGVNIVDILDYANTNKYKTARSLAGGDTNGAGYTWFASGLWRNTSAVSTITIYLNSGFGSHNFTTNAIAALYGIKGA